MRPIRKSTKASAKKPAVLAGGNPQIAKADGDALTPAVAGLHSRQPGWKRRCSGAASTLLIVRNVLQGGGKAVGGTRTLLWHRGPGLVRQGLPRPFTPGYVKVTFFRGTSLSARSTRRQGQGCAAGSRPP